MVTPKVKKRIGSYVYEVYEEKNLKGIFYNVKVYYDGRYVQTIPYLNFEKPQLLSDVEIDIKNKIFTGIDDPIQSKPLPPPPPSTPIEDLPLEPQNKKKSKSEGKIIDNNSNQPIKGAQIEVTKTPGEFNLELSTLSGSNKKQIGSYSYTISQETSQSDIIVKIYYNNELIPGEGLYGGTQSFFYNYTYIPSTDNGPIQSFDGILGVEKWILFQFESHNISPKFYNSDKKEYYPPIDIPNKFENISSDSILPSITTSNNKGEVTLQLPSFSSPISNSYRYEYREVNGGYEVDIFYDNKLIVTQLFDSKNIEINENGKIYSGFEAVKKIVEGNERFGLYKFDKNGKLINEGIGEFRYPKSPIPTSPPLPTITISSPGYETIEKTPYKGDGTVKEDLGVIQMTPIKTATETDKIEASQFKPTQIDSLSNYKKTPGYFAQKKLTDLVINLKGTALPLAITLISSFGVTKASQLIEQGKIKSSDLKGKYTCPTPTELSKLISRKNKLVKQIDNSLKIIDTTTKALGITEGIIILLDTTLFTADNTPTYLNPFPPGINKTLSKTIDGLKATNTGLLTILIIIRQTLTQLLQYLSLLDNLIQTCSPNNTEVQETLSTELTALTIQQSNQTSPVITNVNGFEMGVETEPTTNPLKRRRAIARNKGGVVMLKGEWSFSSIDQILIDELVFYIQQNNLKAD